MRISFSFPASYKRAVEGALAMVLADIALDQKYRSDEDPRVQKFAKIPDAMIDPSATGILTAILVDTHSNGSTPHATAQAAVSSHS